MLFNTPKSLLVAYCILSAISTYGEEVPFPLYPKLCSKLDAKTYAMGETFVFSNGAASIWLNPARMGKAQSFTFGVEYEDRKEEQEIWGKDILNIPQLIGLTYPYNNFTFGILYFVPYNMKMGSETKYRTILRNLSIGCQYTVSPSFYMGGTLGILWGNSDEKFVSEHTKDIKDYKVRGFQGSFGLIWQYNHGIEIGLVLRSPAYLNGNCQWDYSGANWWDDGCGDTTFTKTFSIKERYFYPISVSTGISFRPSSSLTLNAQMYYIGWHVEDDGLHYAFGDDELDMNLGIDWKITPLLSLRSGAYFFIFPSHEEGISNFFVPALTAGLGIGFRYATIDIAIGSGEDIWYFDQRSNFLLVDLKINL